MNLVSTAVALLTLPEYQSTKINILDSLTLSHHPAIQLKLFFPTTASLDSSRIVRSNYSSSFYAALAAAACARWHSSPLLSPLYHESGYALTCSPSDSPTAGENLVRASLANVRALGENSSDNEFSHRGMTFSMSCGPQGVAIDLKGISTAPPAGLMLLVLWKPSVSTSICSVSLAGISIGSMSLFWLSHFPLPKKKYLA